VPDLPQNRARVNVLAASRPWFAGMAERLQAKTGRPFVFLGAKEELSAERLADLNPEYVFLPHWSHIIPSSIHERHECVIFHMTDLPFGRGGSPLQNLIARGIYETRISALRCGAGIDTGPIYLKRPMSLHGNAQEIYARAADIIEGMIADILAQRPVPQDQRGEPVIFARRKPEEGDISMLPDLEKVFDYIRMLDAEGYPHAFLETEHFRLEFSRASLQTDSVVADVRIIKK
jgi:methionyl-tRNA formyltransferase